MTLENEIIVCFKVLKLFYQAVVSLENSVCFI